MSDLSPAMTSVLSIIGKRGVTAAEVNANGVVMKRLAEMGFLQVDYERDRYCPPIYSLSPKGEGAAAVLRTPIQPRPCEGAVARIKRLVCTEFEIPEIEMVSARRSQIVARPRQVAMYLTKKFTPKSLPDIGRHFGNRDHTTVIHAIRKVEGLMEADADFRCRVKRVASLVVEMEHKPTFAAPSAQA